MTKSPFSVVIPVYNGEKTIGRALHSVLQQTHLPSEIIVVDDASTDETVRAASEVLAREGTPASVRHHVLRRETNGGVGAARNAGIQAATRPWIAFLDADDAWHPEKLQRQERVVRRAEPDLGVVYTAFTIVDGNGDPVPTSPYRTCFGGDVGRELLRRNVVGTPSSAVVRASVLQRVGGFAEERPICDDWDLWLRCAPHCQFCCIDERLMTYYDTRVHGQMSANREVVRQRHERILHKHGDRIRAAGAIGFHWHRLGKICIETGDTSAARQYFLKAALQEPTRLRWWGMVAAAWGGRPVFRILQAVKRAILSLR